MSRALIFGRTGQVARELARRVPDGVTAVFLDREAADLCDPAACATAVAAHRPDLVINAAAYTAVDRAEDEEPLASVINGDAPGAIAQAAQALDVPFLHVSTDYVFDGGGRDPWRPDAPAAPLGAYGRSKLAGEIAVRQSGTSSILRVSWVFSAHGSNFVKTMLRLAETRAELHVVADQTGGPTAAADIASTLWSMGRALQSGAARPGVYHFAGRPDASWAEFAREIFARAGRQVKVIDIPTKDYPTPARRPMNSRLDCAMLETEFGLTRPDWRQSLAAVLAELAEAGP